MNRRQGKFDAAEQSFNATIQLDPQNPQPVFDWAETLSYTRQFSAAEGIWNRLIDLRPDQPIVKAQKEACNIIQRTADDAAYRSILGSLPTSLAADRLVLSGRLNVAIDHRDWLQAKELLEKMKGGEDASQFAYAARPVPVSCYSILIARLQREATNTDPGFAEARQLLSRKVETSPADAPSHLSC
jgi:Tfp pilus assembly protein PilF